MKHVSVICAGLYHMVQQPAYSGPDEDTCAFLEKELFIDFPLH